MAPKLTSFAAPKGALAQREYFASIASSFLLFSSASSFSAEWLAASVLTALAKTGRLVNAS